MDSSKRFWDLGERLIEPRLPLHRRYQRPEAHDIHGAHEVVVEHVQRLLSGDARHALYHTKGPSSGEYREGGMSQFQQ